ncbi:hypothetical protein DRQ33_03030 [bacterium]|nr:MAG: hypothetical protein DRQ33_03030 [bacterium]
MIYILQIAILLILLCLSAIFSGSETAFFSISPMHKERIRYRGDNRSRGVLNLLKTPSRLLVTILSGNMLVNIAATSIVTVFFARVFPGKGAVYAIPIMTILLLLFGEITPKVIAARWNMIFARTTTPILKSAINILYPIIFLLEKLSSAIGSKMLAKEELTEADLRAMLDILRRSGNWQPELITALLGTMELDRISILRFIIPRHKWNVANCGASAGELRRKFDPQCGDVVVIFDGNEICGILEPEDLLGIPDDAVGDENALPPVLINSNTSSSSLLETLVGTGIRWAVVVDDDNEPIGLVGTENVLSALVAEETIGELYD